MTMFVPAMRFVDSNALVSIVTESVSAVRYWFCSQRLDDGAIITSLPRLLQTRLRVGNPPDPVVPATSTSKTMKIMATKKKRKVRKRFHAFPWRDAWERAERREGRKLKG